MYTVFMADEGSAEITVREVRNRLADVLNAAAVRDQITFITSRGRRVAAIVSVPVAEAAAEGKAGRV